MLRKPRIFDIPALVRRHPLYFLLQVKQGAVFLINSRQGIFRCGPKIEQTFFSGQGLSRSYARFFAEFLEEALLVRLRLLASVTCVSFPVQAPCFLTLRDFSWKALRKNLLENQNFLFGNGFIDKGIFLLVPFSKEKEKPLTPSFLFPSSSHR